MRNVTCFVLAAALAAAPAAAQNETVADNAVDANLAVMPVDNTTMAANDMAALPPETVTTETTEPAAAPEPKRRSGGFPWGAIGLVGLIGLLGRKRRD